MTCCFISLVDNFPLQQVWVEVLASPGVALALVIKHYSAKTTTSIMDHLPHISTAFCPTAHYSATFKSQCNTAAWLAICLQVFADVIDCRNDKGGVELDLSADLGSRERLGGCIGFLLMITPLLSLFSLLEPAAPPMVFWVSSCPVFTFDFTFETSSSPPKPPSKKAKHRRLDSKDSGSSLNAVPSQQCREVSAKWKKSQQTVMHAVYAPGCTYLQGDKLDILLKKRRQKYEEIQASLNKLGGVEQVKQLPEDMKAFLKSKTEELQASKQSGSLTSVRSKAQDAQTTFKLESIGKEHEQYLKLVTDHSVVIWNWPEEVPFTTPQK
ncbi:hypothetical protein BU17DRAFT_64660 [Hysterangium stoloniferum]|nr:hypothetical protein BU17DRAFT_64660 [Hysterangium stoloniferum]